MNALRSNPVRVYLYTVFAAVVGLLVALGTLTAELAPLVLAVGTAVLAVPAVEIARSKVAPVAKLETNNAGPVVLGPERHASPEELADMEALEELS